ncbi:alpha/beta-hydrolase [Cystobasidium minutum MCA 4210]|uniref:alpha/beta-hydrolase n=1 Tax=Cystobasidium minutum MCA 4210 TaxID=1397322 RepID=UPI0034CDE119|eukprot:jgi/Rhomi1/193977/gm1.2191_g
MAQQQLSSCCVSGHVHEGTPKGKEETIAGLKTYVSPSSDGSKAKTVIFITDIFGYELVNTRLVADEYAAQGFHVVVPDLLEGDYVDHNLLKAIVPLPEDPEPSVIDKAKVAANLGPWVAKHREAVTRPLLEKFVKEIQADSEVKKVGTVGFCWGGRYSILLVSDNDYPKVDAAVANHPSFLAVPDEVNAVSGPTLIQVGDEDAMMSMDQVKQSQEIFSGKSNAEVKVFPGAAHGFTVRGDLTNEKEKKQKEDATEGGIKFLQKYLA